MKPNELIGRREDERLEFKAKEVLARPHVVAREVVAMLNTSDGKVRSDIWIGVAEREAKAVELQSVENAERERARLRDTLVDTIEPRPSSDEVSVSVERTDSGEELLRVSVRARANRQPFALLRDGRHYLLRVQDRLVPMSYDDLREKWERRSSVDRAARDVAAEWLRKRTRDIRRSQRALLWVAAAPTSNMKLDLDRPELVALLTDPSKTGNRASGWNYLRPRDSPIPVNGGRQVGDDRWGKTVVGRNGQVEMEVPMSELKYTGRGLTDSNAIHPFALCEYPTSLVRFVAMLIRLDEGGAGDYRFALALTRARGWKLWPFGPGRMGWGNPFHGVGEYEDADDLLLEPITFRRGELIEAPDHCAYRLVRLIYEAFHLGADKMPPEFDPVTKRLQLG
jgi:hypothetical protein